MNAEQWFALVMGLFCSGCGALFSWLAIDSDEYDVKHGLKEKSKLKQYVFWFFFGLTGLFVITSVIQIFLYIFL